VGRALLISAGTIAALLAPLLLGSYFLEIVNIAILNAMLVLGLNFVTGWTGQINSGQAAFYGIGAYTTAIATRAGAPWLAASLLSALAAAAASLALGLPTLRLRRSYPAMATIGFGEILRLILVHWEPVTGGSSGLRHIAGIAIGPLAPDGQTQHYYLLLAALALATVAAMRIRGSWLGRAMIATRDSEIAAELSGVDTVRTKLLAFMIGAIYAGLAGSFYASYIGYISPDTFTNRQAVLLFTMLIVGGTGSIPGAVIGAFALTILPELLRFLGQWYLVIYGVGVIAVIILAPGGMAAILPRLVRRPAERRR